MKSSIRNLGSDFIIQGIPKINTKSSEDNYEKKQIQTFLQFDVENWKNCEKCQEKFFFVVVTFLISLGGCGKTLTNMFQ